MQKDINKKTEKKILFSPIGGTDPITNFHDGAMLHICRNYLPDKVYLYLSKEMAELHDRNNPYVYCLDQLGEKLNHPFQHEIIRRDDLEEVQLFDTFMEEFQTIIREIQDKEGTEQLLVNISSGTPAMKSALLMLSVLSDGKLIPIQVATPERKMNPRVENKEDYDPAENWEVDEDNQPGMVDRASVASSKNWLSIIKKEIIKKHIEAYNYVAALQVADGMEDVSPVFLKFLQAADARLKLNFKTMDRLLNEIHYDIIPIKESNKKSLVEYVLGLKIRVFKQEYADFIRALSPLLLDLYEMIVKEECKVDVEKDLAHLMYGRYVWDERKVSKYPEISSVLDNAYPRGFRYGQPIGNDHVSNLIKGMVQDKFTLDRVKLLRNVESNVRNVAAHQLVSITNEEIKDMANISAEKILKTIIELMEKYIVKGRKNVWDSYDQMNEMMLLEL